MLESKTFLTHADEYGKSSRVASLKPSAKHDVERLKDPTSIDFRVHSDTDEIKDIMT